MTTEEEEAKRNTAARIANARRAWWAISKNRNKMLLIFQSPEHREKVSKHRKAYFKNKENLERYRAQVRDKDYRKRLSIALKAMWANPENRKRMSEAIKKGRQQQATKKKAKLSS